MLVERRIVLTVEDEADLVEDCPIVLDADASLAVISLLQAARTAPENQPALAPALRGVQDTEHMGAVTEQTTYETGLRRLMYEQGRTYAWLAREMRRNDHPVTSMTLSRWSRGFQPHRLRKNAPHLATILDVEVEALL